MIGSVIFYVACIAVLAYFLLKSRRKYSMNQIITFEEDIASEKMTEEEFYEYCKTLLGDNGYEVTSGEEAGCLGAEKDGVKYAVKCVKSKEPVEVDSVHQTCDLKEKGNCHVGVIMSDSVFAAETVSMAAIMGIVLWDKKKMKELNSVR